MKKKKNKELKTYKILILGNLMVGKSCIFIRYADDFFPEGYIATIGLDYRLKKIKLNNGEETNIQIWDTAGTERYKSLTKNYFRGSNGIIIVYSITDKKSFEDISNWIEQIREEIKDDIIIYLVGNKCDLNNNRVVSYEEGKKISENFHVNFYECSAKTGEGINPLFNDLINQINILNDNGNNNVNENNNKKKKGLFKLKSTKQTKDNDNGKKKKFKC